EEFVDHFTSAAENLVIGNGLDAASQMGPLANHRRIEAMEALIADATSRGGRIRAGGKRIGNEGFFFEPTVLTDVPLNARIM
ncbi:aldehyde dehydrogenase family protein, partial [Acinetobacter baumannii]